jgi:NAD(P)-dependent dehydrogenase (short-subunit alcohol dehydrogenase family)
MFDLSGHVAVVTGGNSGIGLGMARGLAEANASVAIWARNEERNQRAVEDLEGIGGGEKWAVPCDVSDQGQVEAAMEATLARAERVDSCFANAGVPAGATPFVETDYEEWRRVLDVNLDGVFFTLRAAARHMSERSGPGSLVGTASVSALQGMPRGENYAASKGGLIAIVRGLAVELARHEIRANAIVPGWVETPLTKQVLESDAFVQKVLPRVPARRWGMEDDFAGIAAFLAGPSSGYLTGQTIVIDGGYSVF